MADEMAPQPLQEQGALWSRVQEHKVIQWAIGYCGAALALAHGAELVTHALHWPEIVWRAFVIALIAGFPIAVTIAWYHGHRGFKRISAGELSIVSVLLLIGAVFFTAALRPRDEHAAAAAPAREAEAASAAGSAVAAEPTPTTVAANTLAVLPFVNNSSDADQEHFVDGLSAELINSLSRIDGLAVSGRTSSFAFKGSNDRLPVIGQALGVAYAIEGSAQKAGEQIRIAAQLVETRTGRQLWSGAYARAFDDIFAIQDEIVAEVAKALEITLGVGDLGQLPGMTRDVEAYEQYLEANALYSDFELASLLDAIDRYRRAVAIDPAFAAAWMALAAAHADGILLAPERREEWLREAANAADRARQSAPDAFYVAAWDARQRAERGSWREAADFYEQRLPQVAAEYGTNVEAWMRAGRFLMDVGRTTEAIEYFERARAADPLSGGIVLFLIDAYMNAGVAQRAVAEAERGAELEDAATFIRGAGSLAALATRDRAVIDRYLVPYLQETGGSVGRGVHAAMFRFIDDPPRAVAELHALAAADWVRESPIALDALVNWAGYFGEAELALAATRDLRALGNFNTFLLWRPLRADMRKLPGFKDLVREMGLVEYWRERGWPDTCQPVGDNDFACE